MDAEDRPGTSPEERFRVIAYSGYHGEQEPRALIVEGRRLEVVEIRDRWYDPRARHFRVSASDGRTYLLRYDLEELAWSRVETRSHDDGTLCREGGERPMGDRTR